MPMKIFLMGEQAFVQLNKPGWENFMLCIGSKTEVDAADEKRLVEMIHQAIAWSQYREIDTGRRRAIH